ILTLGLSISFQSLLAAYTAPLANPATCVTGNPGCDAPISSGSTLVQMTQGAIWVVNSAYPTSPYGLIVEQGKVVIGAITSDYKLDVQGGQINSSGGYCIAGDCKATWSAIVSAGGGGSTATTNTWSALQTYSAGQTISSGNLTFSQTTNANAYIDSNRGVQIRLDADNNSADNFVINNGANTTVWSMDETGTLNTGAIPWARLATFPAACAAGKYVSGLGATKLTCTPLFANANSWTAVQTFSPSVTINGDLTMNGDINMAGGDIAEGFKVLGKVEPGDVLVINNQADDKLIKSSQPYQKTVAGVVSTDPAVKLGDKNQPQVALSGTAPVKVSNENGSINPGDLLTTSSLSGYAMKCSDQEKCFGAIIGKALEKFSGSTGVIKMLISLQ
ncbi:MAG: hypothetical protein Q8O59_02755, partial [bacterium]|nr:hypothetical protein [bacterium]